MDARSRPVSLFPPLFSAAIPAVDTAFGLQLAFRSVLKVYHLLLHVLAWRAPTERSRDARWARAFWKKWPERPMPIPVCGSPGFAWWQGTD